MESAQEDDDDDKVEEMVDEDEEDEEFSSAMRAQDRPDEDTAPINDSAELDGEVAPETSVPRGERDEYNTEVRTYSC